MLSGLGVISGSQQLACGTRLGTRASVLFNATLLRTLFRVSGLGTQALQRLLSFTVCIMGGLGTEALQQSGYQALASRTAIWPGSGVVRGASGMGARALVLGESVSHECGVHGVVVQ